MLARTVLVRTTIETRVRVQFFFLRMMSFCMREVKLSLVLTYNASWHVMTDLFAYPRFTCKFAGGKVFILCLGYFFYVATFFPWYPHLIIRYSNML